MDAKELQAHILKHYGKSILDMGFVELHITMTEINNALRYEYEEELRMNEITSADHEQWQREIDEDMQREIDEYHQMTIDNELPF